MAAAIPSGTRSAQPATLQTLSPDLLRFIAHMAEPTGRTMVCVNRALRQSVDVNSHIRSLGLIKKPRRITDASLQHIAQKYPNLTKLVIRGATITNLAPLQAFRSLKVLDLTFCGDITDDHIISLKNLPLEALYIEGCCGVIPASLIRSDALPPSLRKLTFDAFSDEARAEVDRLRALCPRVAMYVVGPPELE